MIRTTVPTEMGEDNARFDPTGEPDEAKVSSPVRRGAAETGPQGNRADRPPYVRPRPNATVKLLVAGTAGQANTLALGDKAHLTDRGLAPATITRRLAALRSGDQLARTLGQVTWTIDIGSPQAQAYRDTRGPGLEGWRGRLAAAKQRATTPKGRRDLALIRLMHDLGLRSIERCPPGG